MRSSWDSLTGSNPVSYTHLDVYKRQEDTLVFNSGFSVNIELLSALVKPDDIVFLDEVVHRSLFELSLIHI